MTNIEDRKFSIGDRVILTNHSNNYFRFYKLIPINSIGTIINYLSASETYSVDFHDGTESVFVDSNVISLYTTNKELLEEIIE